MTPRILVVGAGAIGGFYGAKLFQAGAEVSVVARSDYNVVFRKGFNVKSPWGNFHFSPARVLRSTEEYNDCPDYVLVGLKTLPEINVKKLIQPVLGKNTAIVLLQNGIDIEHHLAQEFPQNEIISGLAFICVSRTEPGEIYHQDYGRLTLGLYPDGSSSKTVQLSELFNNSGVPCNVDENVVKARWKKLVWNAPFNPISVLGGGVNTQQILENEESAGLVHTIMKEVCLIAASEGYPLADSVIEKNINDTRTMRPYKTSMLLDYESGLPMEVETILGNAVRIARKRGISVPKMETLYTLLQLTDRTNPNKSRN